MSGRAELAFVNDMRPPTGLPRGDVYTRRDGTRWYIDRADPRILHRRVARLAAS